MCLRKPKRYLVAKPANAEFKSLTPTAAIGSGILVNSFRSGAPLRIGDEV